MPNNGHAAMLLVVIALAPVVREKAVAFGAQDWLDALPGLLAEVAAEWSLTITGSLGGGTEALVAAVTLDDGTAAVLKAPIPRDDEPARREAIALRLAAGTGCARLLRYDERRQVLLLERLGRPLEAMAVGRQQRDEILCATVRRVWRPAADCGLPTGADAGRWLSNWITTAWEETGRPVLGPRSRVRAGVRRTACRSPRRRARRLRPRRCARVQHARRHRRFQAHRSQWSARRARI